MKVCVILGEDGIPLVERGAMLVWANEIDACEFYQDFPDNYEIKETTIEQLIEDGVEVIGIPLFSEDFGCLHFKTYLKDYPY